MGELIPQHSLLVAHVTIDSKSGTSRLCWGGSLGSRALVYLCWGRNPSSHVSVPGNEPQFLRSSLPSLRSGEGLKCDDHMVLHTYTEVVAHVLGGGGEMT